MCVNGAVAFAGVPTVQLFLRAVSTVRAGVPRVTGDGCTGRHVRMGIRMADMKKAGRLVNNIKKTYRYLARNGVRAAALAAAERLMQEGRQDPPYTPPGEEELARQRREAESWQNPPLISVAVPAYETDPVFLKELLDSLQEQTWPYWELVLADAGSTDGVRRAALARSDERIRYLKLASNEGIAANTNEAVRAARGDYIGLLDHDDFLTPDALYAVAEAVRHAQQCGKRPLFLYSDEDKWDQDSRAAYEPHRKMDFNLDLLLSNNYICHFLVMDAELMKSLPERPGYDGAQDYDLVLRAAGKVLGMDTQESRPEGSIIHIPRILYRWRCHRASTASNPESKRYAYEAGKRALEDFCLARGWLVAVEHMPHLGFYHVRYLSDVLSQRPDLGAVAHPLPPVRGRMNSGIYDTDQISGAVSVRYAGLFAGFTGPFHRAVLPQDVEAADIRAMRVRPQLQAELEEALAAIRAGADPVSVSITFCTALRRRGFRILWEPSRKEGTN